MEKIDEHYWLGKAIDIQKKICPEILELNISCVRKKSYTEALKMAEYIYKDIMENASKYPEFRNFLKLLESFTREEKSRAVGLIFEVMEMCEDITCKTKDVEKIAEYWSMSDKMLLLLETFFSGQ